MAKRRTHCSKGHPLTEENVYQRPHGPRQCKICKKAQQREKKTGWPDELYQSTLEEQKGLCAICRQPCATGNSLCGDHSHATGDPRGLLCARCNVVLGKVGESVLLLEAMIAYLIKFWRPEGESNSR